MLQEQSNRILCNLDSACEPKLLALVALNLNDWSSFQRWTAKVEVSGLPAATEQSYPGSEVLIKRMVDAEAVSPSSNVLVLTHSSGEQEALTHLQSIGVVACLASLDSGVSHWQLTDVGMKSLQTRLVLSQPKHALVARDVPPHEMLTWELLNVLLSSGWEMSVRARGRGAGPKPAPYRSGGAKVWWIRGGDQSVHREYLLALIVAAEAAQGSAESKEVPHFAKKSASGTGSTEAGLGGMPTSASFADHTSDLPPSNQSSQVPPATAAVANMALTHHQFPIQMMMLLLRLSHPLPFILLHILEGKKPPFHSLPDPPEGIFDVRDRQAVLGGVAFGLDIAHPLVVGLEVMK